MNHTSTKKKTMKHKHMYKHHMDTNKNNKKRTYNEKHKKKYDNNT